MTAYYGTPTSTPTDAASVLALVYSSPNDLPNLGVSSAGLNTVKNPVPNFSIPVVVGSTRVVLAYPDTTRVPSAIRVFEYGDSEMRYNFVLTSVLINGVQYKICTYTPIEPFTIFSNYKVFL